MLLLLGGHETPSSVSSSEFLLQQNMKVLLRGTTFLPEIFYQVSSSLVAGALCTILYRA